jgi:hypothetical protein
MHWGRRNGRSGQEGVSASPEPKDEEEKSSVWKYKISFLKARPGPQRAPSMKYFTMMARAQDPAARIKALDALTALNPKETSYLGPGAHLLFSPRTGS